MRMKLLAMMILFSSIVCGQKLFNKKITINGIVPASEAFVFFPLINDTLKFDSSGEFKFDPQDPKRQLFYFVLNDQKSRIYNLKTDSLLSFALDSKIPDPLFFKNLYEVKRCPLCHSSDNVVPFIYGKPSKKLIEEDKEGKVKLAGCTLSNTSPELYCKTDHLEF